MAVLVSGLGFQKEREVQENCAVREFIICGLNFKVAVIVNLKGWLSVAPRNKRRQHSNTMFFHSLSFHIWYTACMHALCYNEEQIIKEI